MNSKQRNSLSLVGVLLGLASLPLTWMTIRNPTLTFDVGGFQPQLGGLMPMMAMDVTALNGHVTLLFKTPIWLIVGGAILANLLVVLRGTDLFEVPTAAIWVIALLAGAWSVVPLVASFSGQATPGIGLLLGLACAAMPIICLVAKGSQPGEATQSADEVA
ncbi:MAG: hypothetical protein AAGJ46_15745 [Planctomycetota bacterium]